MKSRESSEVLRIAFTSYLPVLRIRDVYPGSEFFLFRIPDPGSKRFLDPGSASSSKNLRISTPQKFFRALRYMLRDVHLGSGS
jgi:hypothetical protein